MKSTISINGKDVEVFDLESIASMKSNTKYKVIQLEVGERKTMIFGNPKNFHAEILEAYLLEENIPYTKDTLEDGNKGPKKQGMDYKIIGAGYITKKNDVLELSEKSIGYNLSPSIEYVNELKKEMSLDVIIENDALKKIKEKERLDCKLNFLHRCLAGVFEEADKYFDELNYLVESEKDKKIIGKKYNSLKSIYSKAGEDSLFKEEYIQELRELRDVLLDDKNMKSGKKWI